jgi:hypothetical protein
MLVSFLPPIRATVPHEPGEWIEFRKPSSKVAQEAKRAVEAEGRKGMRDIGADIIKAFMSGDDDEKAVRRARKMADAAAFDVSGFDRATLLQYAIVQWSYTDPVANRPIAVTPENIDELDEETARWAHQTVVDLMKPTTQEADKSVEAYAASSP